MEEFFIEITTGVIVALISSGIVLSYLLAQKSHELRLAHKEIDTLIEELKLPAEALLRIRSEKSVARRFEKLFDALNEQINGLQIEVETLKSKNKVPVMNRLADELDEMANC